MKAKGPIIAACLGAGLANVAIGLATGCTVHLAIGTLTVLAGALLLRFGRNQDDT